MATTATLTVAGRLKAIRGELGLTQKEFASGAGLSYSMITQSEIGAQTVGDKTIRKICNAYSVNEKWLRFGDGRMFVDEHLDAADNQRDAFNLFVRVFNLTPDKQLQLAAFAGYDVDAADIYSRSTESTQVGTTKRNVARLLKAIDNGSVGRVANV